MLPALIMRERGAFIQKVKIGLYDFIKGRLRTAARKKTGGFTFCAEKKKSILLVERTNATKE